MCRSTAGRAAAQQCYNGPPTIRRKTQWALANAGGIMNGRCVDIAGASNANGTAVQLYDGNGTGAQQWQAQSNGTLRNPVSNRCLDASNNSSANGTRLHIWDCFGGANQR